MTALARLRTAGSPLPPHRNTEVEIPFVAAPAPERTRDFGQVAKRHRAGVWWHASTLRLVSDMGHPVKKAVFEQSRAPKFGVIARALSGVPRCSSASRSWTPPERYDNDNWASPRIVEGC